MLNFLLSLEIEEEEAGAIAVEWAGEEWKEERKREGRSWRRGRRGSEKGTVLRFSCLCLRRQKVQVEGFHRNSTSISELLFDLEKRVLNLSLPRSRSRSLPIASFLLSPSLTKQDPLHLIYSASLEALTIFNTFSCDHLCEAKMPVERNTRPVPNVISSPSSVLMQPPDSVTSREPGAWSCKLHIPTEQQQNRGERGSDSEKRNKEPAQTHPDLLLKYLSPGQSHTEEQPSSPSAELAVFGLTVDLHGGDCDSQELSSSGGESLVGVMRVVGFEQRGVGSERTNSEGCTGMGQGGWVLQASERTKETSEGE